MNDLSKRKDIKIIEDCAQSLGSRINKKFVGTFGDLGCFSFQESKNITTGGEGGIIVSNNKELIEKAKIIANEGEVYENGKSTTFKNQEVSSIDYIFPGYNYRMNAVQAAIGIAQLKKLNRFILKRRKIAKFYNKALTKFTDIVKLPSISSLYYSSFNNYTLLIKNPKINRDLIVMLLSSKGIPAYPYYPHKLTDYTIISKKIKNKEIFKNTDYFCKNQFTLPIHTSLTKKEVIYITKNLKNILNELKC